MFKKFFSAVLLAAVLIFSRNFAQAQDVYVGTSNATGWDCYIMTETIQHFDGGIKKATLKMVTQSKNVKYLNYRFEWDAMIVGYHFSNSSGFSGIVDRYSTPIEWSMLQVITGK